ncbi:MAG: hypothetical protein LH650_00030 [Chloroflexi bacterium]|nr:hypothetical protein [Chloroflexota bacterium]
MMSRTQISLTPETHRLARRRAAERGVSLAAYLRSLVERDLAGPPRPAATITALFDLGASDGSDVAQHKDGYVGAAVAVARPRR